MHFFEQSSGVQFSSEPAGATYLTLASHIRTRKIKGRDSDSNKYCSDFCYMAGGKKGRILLLSSYLGFFRATRAFPALVAIFRIKSRDTAERFLFT